MPERNIAVDPRYRRLAEVLTQHSLKVQPGEAVLLSVTGADPRFVEALIEAIGAAGGIPVPSPGDTRITRKLLQTLDADGFRLLGELEAARMHRMHGFVGVRGGNNASELADLPAAQMRLFREHVLEPVHYEIRVPKTKWVVLRWPTPGMAQAASMSTEAFEQYYFDVCTLDYGKLQQAMAPLKARMEAADTVRIVGPGETDLRFSIKDIPVIPCFGERNLPDGECFTAPVRDSVEGVIHYNTPTIYEGVSFQNVRLAFARGRIVEAHSEVNNDRLQEIFDTDEGARYVGEFSVGLNPYIREPMKDILFDEKITGSMHFTPGQAYEVADNGNRSKIHWDLVLIQRAEYGGGELWFDDELIRQDGLFVVDDLQALNPDALLAQAAS